MTLVRSALAAALIIGVTGCTVFPEREVRRMFTLTDPVIEASEAETNPFTIRVDTPRAQAPLDTGRIIVEQHNGELTLYGNSRWRDQLPVIVREQLVEGLRQDGRMGGVINEFSRARSDLSLLSDLSRFQIRLENGVPVASIRLDVQLLDDRTRVTLAHHRFTITEPTDSETVEDAVAAFSRGTQQLVEQVVSWALEQITLQASPVQ